MKYIEREDYEGIEVPDGGLHRIACCDCGLVHDMAVAIEDNGNIGLAFKRNNRATGQRRRYMKDKIANLVEDKGMTGEEVMCTYCHRIELVDKSVVDRLDETTAYCCKKCYSGVNNYSV